MTMNQIKEKKFMKIKLLAFLALSLFFNLNVFAQANTAGTRPNIIIILADDLGYADVGFNRTASFPSELGAIPTPNLDTLADNGIVCNNGHVAHPFCGPSRAAIMTGMYPHRIGAQYNLPNDTTTELGVPSDTYPNEAVFFPELIDATGYNTAAFGKWHLGFKQGKYQPLDHGFDYFFGFLGGGKPYFEAYYEDNFIRRINNGQAVTNEYQDGLWRDRGYIEESEFSDAPEEDYLTDILTDDAISYIAANASSDPNDDPFFIYLAYNAPHTPLEAPAAEIAAFKAANSGFEDAYRNSTFVTQSNQVLKEAEADRPAKIEEFVEDRMIYATMVSNMDTNIGRIVTELKKDMDVFNNTVIIFLSDNGGYTHSKGAVNYPLASLKGSVDEGGHRVPFFVHWPAQITTPGTYDYQVSSIDLYPTLVSLAGGTIPNTKTIDGVNFMDKLIDGDEARPGEPLYVLRPQNGFHNAAVVSYPYRMTRKGGNGAWKLYDVRVNPEVQLTGSVDGTPVSQIINDLEDQAAEWARGFINVYPSWFDHERGDGHPHRILWFGEDNSGNTATAVFPGLDSTYNDPTLIPSNLSADDVFGKLFSIYPNPTKDYVNFNFKESVDKLELEVLSISGQSIKKFKPSSNNPRLDISDLKQGTYILRINADNNLSIEKVIKL